MAGVKLLMLSKIKFRQPGLKDHEWKVKLRLKLLATSAGYISEMDKAKRVARMMGYPFGMVD